MTKLIESALAHAWQVQWYDELDSTNLEAKRRASLGEYGPVWIGARKQISGKGRLGRAWASSEGNLATSVLFLFDGSFELISKLSFVAGLAIFDAALASGVPDKKLQLKWPNDIRCDTKKLSGILIETGHVSSDLNWVVVGMGVNIDTAPKVDQETIALRDLISNKRLNADMFLENLKLSFGNRLHSLIKFGFGPIKEDWLSHAEGLNKEIAVSDGQKSKIGKMLGIDDTGALLLQISDGRVETITTGDVNLVG